jgi:hypothetical protein
MRKNEYNSIDEFVSQYTGVWNPSERHWFGLDFSYNGSTYRLNTGSMFNKQNTILPDGREAVFGLYRKTTVLHFYYFAIPFLCNTQNISPLHLVCTSALK